MGIPSWASIGYEAVAERDKQVKDAQTFIPGFFLKSDEEAVIRFLTVNPITYWEHFLRQTTGRRNYTCIQGVNGQDCPLCNAGNKPSFRGAFVVIDQRYEEFKRNSGEVVKQQNTVKIMKQGLSTLKVLEKHEAKRGLANFDWEVSRTGEGTDTRYTFIPVEKSDFVVPAEIQEVNWQERIFQELSPLSSSDLMRVLQGQAPQGRNSNTTSGGTNTIVQFGSTSITVDDDFDPDDVPF